MIRSKRRKILKLKWSLLATTTPSKRLKYKRNTKSFRTSRKKIRRSRPGSKSRNSTSKPRRRRSVPKTIYMILSKSSHSVTMRPR